MEEHAMLEARWEARGWRGRFVAGGAVEDLQKTLEAMKRQGHFPDVVAQAYAADLCWESPRGNAVPPSLCILAIPDGVTRMTFVYEGRLRQVLLPPIYGKAARWRAVEETVRRDLEVLGHWVTPACLPFKLLASRSGVGAVGRHTLCHVPGMGTAHRLMAFSTSVPCAVPLEPVSQRFPECEGCFRCRDACPTGAIPEQGALRSDRCMTFWSENAHVCSIPSGGIPHTLVGCLRCQMACPATPPEGWRVESLPGGDFSEAETETLLGGTPYPQALRERIRDLGFAWLEAVWGRNLRKLWGLDDRYQI